MTVANVLRMNFIMMNLLLAAVPCVVAQCLSERQVDFLATD